MLIRADRSYNNRIIDYLKKEEEYNITPINDIEKYGYGQSFFNIWAQLDSSYSISAVIFRYFNILTIYSSGEYKPGEVYNLIRNINFTEIMGKSTSLNPLREFINIKRERNVKLCRLNSEKFLDTTKNVNYRSKNIKKIRVGNIRKVVKLYEYIDEFENTTIDNIRSGLKTGRGYYIAYNKQIVSMAKSTSECKNYAMVIGVGTHPEYRNQGLATLCTIKLCNDLVRENKTPCLFYDNEAAGKIYRKLGFEEVGDWSIYYL